MAEDDERLRVWRASVPSESLGDRLWSLRVYHIGRWLADLPWEDVSFLHRDGPARGIAHQLYRAVGSISAIPAEGYPRGRGKDRARCSESARSSVQEARAGICKARHRRGERVARARIHRLTDVARRTLGLIQKQPGRPLREPGTDSDPTTPGAE